MLSPRLALALLSFAATFPRYRDAFPGWTFTVNSHANSTAPLENISIAAIRKLLSFILVAFGLVAADAFGVFIEPLWVGRSLTSPGQR